MFLISKPTNDITKSCKKNYEWITSYFTTRSIIFSDWLIGSLKILTNFSLYMYKGKYNSTEIIWKFNDIL